MTEKKLVSLGYLDLENVSRIWVRTKEGGLFVWDATGKITAHDPMDRVGGPYRIADVVEDGETDKWFLFAVVDCYFPCRDLVCGRSWEDAYETYLDWAAEHRNIKIEEPDLKDYLNEKGEYEGSYTSTGDPVETDNIHGEEVELVAIEFGKGTDEEERRG